jgi:hypothetical protein
LLPRKSLKSTNPVIRDPAHIAELAQKQFESK